ncbi:PTS sugar transporter subunit IIA [Streptococcus chenjunshii]|uniref:PTS sugar transporter subunit IIA n=1 Tax=Streptococcus chenjunshii TaxID=2173853 RepID=A0A372KL80_9STRE|nr:PTS sugar transporter subunit IIA [Streptococcus chenjunshii]AXQ77639.1 PTS sugar transporter subunit IIA [Streptococcus chenjunshii]RFU50609.1 PTS sugar transporter subunit IIA [Streptococcus chenjunshii]RFU52746.1 PTS sugar transporter subunit IIA [Streptococcus chenjunshii]
MNQVILIAHGHLAAEMKASAEMLFGELPQFHTIDFLEEDGLESLSSKIYQKMKTLNCPLLIFTDLFGGTPFNASCSVALRHPDLETEIVSGMSLPLVLELAAILNSRPLKEIASALPSLVAGSVRLFDRQLNQPEAEREDLL